MGAKRTKRFDRLAPNPRRTNSGRGGDCEGRRRLARQKVLGHATRSFAADPCVFPPELKGTRPRGPAPNLSAREKRTARWRSAAGVTRERKGEKCSLSLAEWLAGEHPWRPSRHPVGLIRLRASSVRTRGNGWYIDER
jgi:hypothetical protein